MATRTRLELVDAHLRDNFSRLESPNPDCAWGQRNMWSLYEVLLTIAKKAVGENLTRAEEDAPATRLRDLVRAQALFSGYSRRAAWCTLSEEQLNCLRKVLIESDVELCEQTYLEEWHELCAASRAKK